MGRCGEIGQAVGVSLRTGKVENRRKLVDGLGKHRVDPVQETGEPVNRLAQTRHNRIALRRATPGGDFGKLPLLLP